MMGSSLNYIGVIVLLLLMTQAPQCQSYFYNTQQFGLKSTMLGGAVTAGNGDLSMAYYNPAALHLANSSADFSIIRPQFSLFSLDDYFGKEVDKLDIDVDLSTSLASFRIRLNEKINLVFIYIKRSSWNNRINSKGIQNEGEVTREQVFKYNYSGTDRWVGVGSSYRLNDHVFIGFSQFFSFSKVNYGYTLSSQRYDRLTNDQLSYFSNTLISSYSNNFSSLSKLGLHINYAKHQFGLVLKTPNYFSLFNSGSYEHKVIDLDQSNSTATEIIDFELNPNIKTPWEFYLGYACTLNGGSKIWLNISYYTAVSGYQMAIIENISGRDVSWTNGSQAKGNLSIGYSNVVSPKFEILSSVRTNLFAYKNRKLETDETRLFILDHDQYHMTLGGNIKFKNNSVLLGLDYGFSQRANEELFDDFPDIDRLNTTSSSFKNNTLTIFLTYGFILDNLKIDSVKRLNN